MFVFSLNLIHPIMLEAYSRNNRIRQHVCHKGNVIKLTIYVINKPYIVCMFE